MGTVLATIFVLGVLIFVHELGHFLVAKAVGIRVEKFSLGFPPKLFGFKKGDTEYCISVIPLGGYVKMAGENPDESEVTGAPDEFMSKTPLQRAAVIFAGPFMNYVTAFLIYFGLYSIQGVPTVDNSQFVIGGVAENAPAEQAGLQEGDVILSVDGSAITSLYDLSSIVSEKPGEEVSVEYRRGDQVSSVSLVTKVDTVLNAEGGKEPVGLLGVLQNVWYERPGFFSSVALGAQRTWEMTVLVCDFFYRLVTLQMSPKLIGGPVFIAKFSGEAAKQGASTLLYFIAMLSVNLAIINVLPIPVLDGGHLMFLVIERIRKKPLSLKQRAAIQQVGLAFLLVMIVFVTYNDIVRWLSW